MPGDMMSGMVMVIGTMKAGTSSLHHYLDLHPEIQMSRVKELNFFINDKAWRRGLGWYRRQIAPPGQSRWRGESSVNYTKFPVFPNVPERMSQVMPQARLIYVVRDPVERVYSHYVHNLSHGREVKPIAEGLALPEVNDYVYPSRYALQLKRFLKFYSLEQLLIIDHHTLRHDRVAALRQVFEFLEVDADFTHPDFEREHHQSKAKAQPTALARRLQRVPGGRLLRYGLPMLFEEPLVRPELPEDTRQALMDVLMPEVEELEALTGVRVWMRADESR